ncbi:copper chaperone PCu(A)C [Roseibium litorale]|uniref:Copper chaperone PCu(A)C n=1 Tax=Roseibium litorale TaxID=2803841 RepID=A0ABR9CT84_9HYPH|nr:copper chaperone PCu(A)C [Roseibium litorale]MBD8893908.1 copper chaperone PCu(A)C [Roseibium litorale]
MLVKFAASFALLASLSVPALSEDAAGHHHHEAEHVSELGGVRIVHAWTRATDGKDALVFFELENGSDKTVTLLGGESEAAGAVALVGIDFKGGEAKLVPLPQIPVKPGSELHLDPESVGLQLSGLTAPLHQGDVIEVEVELDLGHLDVDVEVEAAGAKGHSHAGHSH